MFTIGEAVSTSDKDQVKATGKDYATFLPKAKRNKKRKVSFFLKNYMYVYIHIYIYIYIYIYISNRII